MGMTRYSVEERRPQARFRPPATAFLAAAFLLASGTAGWATDTRGDVRGSVETLNAALSTGDLSAIRALAGPSFTMVEDGVEYRLAGTIAALIEARKGGPIKRATRDIRVEIYGRAASVIYRVAVTFQGPDGAVELTRVETAVLVRGPDGWRVECLTSMLEAPAANAAGP